ncbi:hypothetical protein EON65_47750 [archaeon]|nr:MAG: hypothetical protein EON65_47750 [archaeon]
MLNFASSLNYDKYISDLEVQLMMEKLKKRIQELEREVSLENEREQDSDLKVARREMLALMNSTEQTLKDNQDTQISADNEAIQTAKLLLQEQDNEINANVHSTKSVVALLQTAREKIAKVQDTVKAQTVQIIMPVVTNEVWYDGISIVYDDVYGACGNLCYAMCVYVCVWGSRSVCILFMLILLSYLHTFSQRLSCMSQMKELDWRARIASATCHTCIETRLYKAYRVRFVLT